MVKGGKKYLLGAHLRFAKLLISCALLLDGKNMLLQKKKKNQKKIPLNLYYSSSFVSTDVSI